jgi:hypothetical protein
MDTELHWEFPNGTVSQKAVARAKHSGKPGQARPQEQ